MFNRDATAGEEDHPAVVQNAVDEIAVGREPGTVPVFDVIAGYLIAALIGAFAISPRLIIAAVRKQLVPDMAVFGDPHSNIGVIGIRHLFLSNSRGQQERRAGDGHDPLPAHNGRYVPALGESLSRYSRDISPRLPASFCISPAAATSRQSCGRL